MYYKNNTELKQGMLTINDTVVTFNNASFYGGYYAFIKMNASDYEHPVENSPT